MRQNRGINCAGDSIMNFQNTKNTMKTAVWFFVKNSVFGAHKNIIVLIYGGSSSLYSMFLHNVCD